MARFRKKLMRIFDCFQFFDEEMLLDLRLNIMDKYVDKFVITEATYMHSGRPKKLLFDINKYSKFKDKIIYIVVDEQPPDIFKIEEKDNNIKDTRGQKLVLNGLGHICIGGVEYFSSNKNYILYFPLFISQVDKNRPN